MTKPRLACVRHVYKQERDCCDATESDQTLKLSTDDGGGGTFVILKTRRWAIDVDGFEDFVETLRAFVFEAENVDGNL